MTSRRSAGSIFWGLTLVVIGGLFLARNIGYAVPIWGTLALYWPALIIVWGLVKLFDYIRLRRSGDARRLFSAGEAAALIFVIFAGSAMTAAANFSPGFAGFLDLPSDFDFWDITGNNYEYTEHLESEAAPGMTIEIANLYGSVDVQASGANRITLDVRKTVRAASRQEADSMAGQFTFSIQNRDGKIRIASSRDEDSGQAAGTARAGNERRRYKSSLTIHVPASASLDLSNRNGSVKVSDLTGNQRIVNRFGEVTLRAITGSVTVENRYAGVVIEDVSAAASIINRYGSITARGVGGAVRIENRYGSVDVRDVKADAVISNTYSAINAADIVGRLEITGRNNSVDVEGSLGPLSVETSYKGLGVRNPQGRVEARNRHGDITMDFDRTPPQPVSISTEYGNVVLNLPSGAAFSIDARTRSGEISSEFEELRVESSGRERSLSGRTGNGGSQITIETRNGDIRIGKRG